MSDITLSASVRDSLLSLQGTTNLIERTQGRLSSGLRVAGPIDDPVSFFQAKGLNNRAFDFNEKKDGIDQGVSTLTAALDGVEAIETLVRQLKGVAQSMKSAEEGQMDDLISQFNDLRDQINNLATDSTYQGTNLINSTGTTMEIEFSEKTASMLTVNSVNLTVDDTTGGLNVQSVNKYTGEFVVDHALVSANSGGSVGNIDTITAGTTVAMTWQGPDNTYTTSDSVTFTIGDDDFTVTFSSATILSSTGTTFNLTINSGHDTAGGIQANSTEVTNFAYSLASGSFSGGDRFYEIGTGGGVSASSVVTAAAAGSASEVVTLMDSGDTISMTWNGSTTTFSTANNGSQELTVNGVTFTFHTTSATTLSAGEVLTLALHSTAGNISTASDVINLVACGDNVVAYESTAAADAGVLSAATYFAATTATPTTAAGTFINCAAAVTGTTNADYSAAAASATYGVVSDGAVTGSLDLSAVTTAAAGSDYVRAGDTTLANLVIDDLDDALTTLRTESQNLGTNVAVLQTRLDFTETYVNTLESGAAKLTLADINEEGANLLALQTRQQLGIQSLSFAGQAEQQILSLFR